MIAINGMDMPSTCEECIFCGPFWWCQLIDKDLNPVEGWSDWDKERHPDCPLRKLILNKNTIWKEEH